MDYTANTELPESVQPYAQGVWNEALRDELQADMDAHAANYEETITEAPE